MNPSKESLKLVEGEVYTFKFSEIEEGKKKQKKKQKKKRMRLVKCYKYHAVFESPTGVQQSYRYWDIEKLLLGEPR